MAVCCNMLHDRNLVSVSDYFHSHVQDLRFVAVAADLVTKAQLGTSVGAADIHKQQ
jgi:hypothetical protein